MSKASNYTEADVELVREAMEDKFLDHCFDVWPNLTGEARAALDVIAKRLKARALLEAASTLRQIADHGADGEATPYETADWLTARAEEIEADQ